MLYLQLGVTQLGFRACRASAPEYKWKPGTWYRYKLVQNATYYVHLSESAVWPRPSILALMIRCLWHTIVCSGDILVHR